MPGDMLLVHLFVSMRYFLSFLFFCSWRHWLDASYDCDTPWTFLLTVFNANGVDPDQTPRTVAFCVV